MIFAEGTFAISSPFTETTEPVKSRFLTAPYPTTTTSSNAVFSFVNAIVCNDTPGYTTSRATYPTKLNDRYPSDSLAFNTNRPDSSVEVEEALVSPSNRTVTPANGNLVF